LAINNNECTSKVVEAQAMGVLVLKEGQLIAAKQYLLQLLEII